MRNIQPTTECGTTITGIRVSIVEDNLQTECGFRWVVFNGEGTPINDGVIICAGTDYENWNGDNNFPYIYTTGIKNFVLID